ncbi:MAG: hypothetical protein ACRESZ_13715 [Methylococcales bacterium]
MNNPDYQNASDRPKTVVPAGIAGTQKPRMASIEYIHVFWIPAIPAGMTTWLKHLANQVNN